MAESIQAQIDKLQASIGGLEAQRSLLGNEIVEPALATLREKLAALEQQSATQAAPAEDRRMVTILFTDMVGSTAMAEKLDPEEWRRIVSKVHSVVGKAVTAHHGTIAQYLGDGLLAFFGAKEASEADPENAIRAALDAVTAAGAIHELPPQEPHVQIRVGIHTGLVVVGELGAEAHKEFTASGDAMNLAARLQSAAPPGGILISHDTYRYVRGVFDMLLRPPLSLKGKSEPVQTYLVQRAKPRPFRSVTRGVAGIETRTVGRENETQALQQAYLRAFEGHGLVWAQLLGEPGVGKSRLLADMNDWLELRQETYRLLRARTFPDDLNQPFALVRRIWFDRFQIAEDAPLEQAERKWVERFRELSGMEDCEEAAHALGLLVGLPFKDSPHIKAMRNDPNQVKGRALVVSRELVDAIRRQYPLVLLLEDLQWTDPPSWEYLMETFLGEAEGQPNGLFILGAARPDWCPPQKLTELIKISQSNGTASRSSWPKAVSRPGEAIPSIDEITTSQMTTGSRNDMGQKWGTLIPLAPLTDQAMGTLAREIFQRVADVPGQVIDLLVERSEGVPYYTEELVNWFIDHGILDTYSEQWHFHSEKLKEQPLPTTLQHLLLTRLGSLSQEERAALQRGAIFGRRFWSGGVEALGVPAGAETLAHLQPRGFVEAQPESAFQGDTEWSFHQSLMQEVTYESVLKRERLALHKVAADWLEQQARQAGRLEEFAGLLGEHCERAGELSAAADWYLQAGQRAFSQGAPPEAMEFYRRAIELLPPVDRVRRWQALLGRLNGHYVLAEPEPWKTDINALLELAHSFGDDNHLAEAYFQQAVGNVGWKEDPAGADQALQSALQAARRCGNEAIETKTLCQMAALYAARVNQLESFQTIEEALQLARRLGDESVLAYVLARAGFCYGQMGDIARAYAIQTEQVELNRRLGDRVEEATGLNNIGSSLMTVGMYKQARALFDQARAINEALGSQIRVAFAISNLGEIHRHIGDLRKARQLLEQALLEYSPSKDFLGISFILNELGLVLLAIGDVPGASRQFSEAHRLSLNVGGTSWACEASAGLAACAIAQGQTDEAHKYVYEAWEHLKTVGPGMMENPAKTYQICCEVFEALGDNESARAALEAGYRNLMEKADTLTVPGWRQSFLENVPDNRALLEMWERRKV